MALFLWSDSELSVGNSLMDSDHRQMVVLLNDLFLAMERHEGKVVLVKLLGDLTKFTQEHFKREEEIMQRIGYAEQENHKQEHDRLNSEVQELQKRFNGGKSMLSIEVSRFLSDWVFNHIIRDDRKLAAAIRAAEQSGNSFT